MEAHGAHLTPSLAGNTRDGTLRDARPSNKARVAELEAQLAESLSTQNMESSALHCQIAKLLSQLECREAEKRELEANLALTQRHNQQTLKEREQLWGDQEASLLLRNQESQRLLREKEKEREAKEKEVEAKEREVEAKEREVEAKEREVEAKEREVEAKEREVEAKEREVEAKEREVEAKEKEVEAKEREVEAKEREVEAKEREVEAKEREVEACEARLDLLSQQLRTALNERETEWEGLQTSYQMRLSSLSEQCRQWRRTLEAVQQARAKERQGVEQIISAKENQINSLSTRLDEVTAKAEQVTFELSNVNSEVIELKHRLQVSESDAKALEGRIHRWEGDLSVTASRERQLQQQMQEMSQRADSAERELAQERSLFRDHRFNSDLAQQQVKELEASLERERADHRASLAREKELEKTVQALRNSLEEREDTISTLKEKLELCASEQRRTLEKCQQKQATIAEMAHQVQTLCNEAKSLREEQNLAQRKLFQLEEAHFNCLREADSVVAQFEARLSIKKKRGSDHDEGLVNPSPTYFPEKLRLALMLFQSSHEDLHAQLDAARSQLSSVQGGMEQVTMECATSKESLSEKSVALVEAEKRLQAAARELAWYRTQASHIEKKYLVLEREISYHCNRDKMESSRQKQSTGKLKSMNEKLSSENVVHCRFLTELLQLLGSEASQSCDWNKLAHTVKCSIQTQLNLLKQVREELDCCKVVMERQNSLLENAAQLHEDALVKQELEERERENMWEQRLTKVRQSYESLLTEGSGRTNANLQPLLTEHFHELEELRTQKQQLELSNTTLSSQLSQARSSHKAYKNDRACLLCCVCLLAGSLFAGQERIQQLCLQKHLLLRTMDPQLHQPRCSSKDRGHSLPKCLNSGITHFRIVAIVVMALFRLRKLKSTRLSSSEFRNHLGVFPYIGHKAYGSKLTASSSECVGVVSDRGLARWLRSEQVLLDVRECFSSLQRSLDVHSLHHSHEHYQQAGVQKPMSISSSSTFGELGKEFKSLTLKCHQDFLGKARGHFNLIMLCRGV